MSEAYPHLIFHNFTTTLGARCTNILKYLFPVPKEESKRVMTFANQDDTVSFRYLVNLLIILIIKRHHTYTKDEHGKVVLKEIGPRAELKLYQIKQGTLDKEATANTEWRMHPYMNTAKKRRFL